ncbi:MAG: deoxyribose-phosphate aldolase [Desulfobacteraceae bacterium]|nr:deoxyribose-phosphate aldolase [Desulfobacteraceae bacterium]
MFSRQQIISLIDLTSLNDNDTPEAIEKLCNKATTASGNVAAVCIYPQFIAQAKKLLQDTGIKVATVANFPSGDGEITNILSQIKQSLLDGADEIDVVIPYKDYIADGTSTKSIEIVRAAKKLCKNKTLKVIIESGSLKAADLIEKAAEDAILAGADFIKTSTGKVEVGATLDAAGIMLKAVAGIEGRKVGFKASGGVKNYEQSCQYLDLATKICGSDFISNNYFRFGASSLLDDLLGNKNKTSENY